MNRIQKAVTALIALTITLVGAALATAPLVAAASRPLTARAVVSAFGLERAARPARPLPRRA